MKKRLALKSTVTASLIAICLATQFAHGQSDIVAKFVSRVHEGAGISLPYRLYIPDNYMPTKKYPVVLALHGSGERGTDNLRHIQANRLATSWADPINQAKYPCFVVAPQCPPNGSWSGFVLQAANTILDTLTREFPIDTNRFYVTGLSMGGYGTWLLIATYPDRFAAAVPMSGGVSAQAGFRIVKVPIWNFHGAADDVVPATESRNIISALRSLGRKVVYTHCNDQDCIGLPDSTINTAVRNHADLLYTEYQGGGHVIWNESYDYPHLFPWVFDKCRKKGGVKFSNLPYHLILKGIIPITWNASATGGTVELWFSSDAGATWKLIENTAPNSGTYQWNTALFGDCSFGQLRIYHKDSLWVTYGYDLSSYFTIKNSSTGPPFVGFADQDFAIMTIVTKDSIDLHLLLGDPDHDSLSVSMSYSADRGSTYQQLAVFQARPDSLPQTLRIGVAGTPNSKQAILKAVVSDGKDVCLATTTPFNKQTPRLAGPGINRTNGAGGGKVSVQVVNPKMLTGHRYRITFNTPPLLPKTYTVRDLNLGTNVIEQSATMDGVTEGPVFDGLCLIILDYRQTLVDKDSSRWISGRTTVSPTIGLPLFYYGSELVQGYPAPYDYKLTIASTIVDTSKALYDVSATPMKFRVSNVTKGVKTDIVFVDTDADSSFTQMDEIYFLDADSIGKPILSWSMSYVANPGTVLPAPGDEFLLRTLKPFGSDDTIEFSGVMVSVPKERIPLKPMLDQNYPNPFNPTTTIRFSIPQLALTRLSIFDILGREVAVLVNEKKDAGRYAVQWDASRFPSGVYFYRLEAGKYTETKKLILLR